MNLEVESGTLIQMMKATVEVRRKLEALDKGSFHLGCPK